MQFFPWLVVLILFLMVFIGIPYLVKRGGRKVQVINPKDLILYPAKSHENEQLSLVKRFIPLDGTANFRDIGGYLTNDGRRVRMGRVYRSDELSTLSDMDLTTLGALGMQRILDLRSKDEVRKRVDRIPGDAPFRYIHTPVYDKEPRWDYLPAILFNRHQLGKILSARYFFMVEKRAEVFGKILTYFADIKNLPAVYHCTAGQDRTGIVTALILSLLGVPDETIIADYSLSNLGFDHYFDEFVADRRHSPLGVPDEEFQGLFIVRPVWMRKLLAHLQQSYGSVESYLLHKGNMQPAVIEQIRENLLV